MGETAQRTNYLSWTLQETGSPPPPDVSCNPGLQTCPDGAKCGAFISDGGAVQYQCVEDFAVYKLWEPCERLNSPGNDGCPSGSACLPPSLSIDSGLCMPLCLDDDHCENGQRCVSSVDVNVPYCAPGCAPLTPNCPSPGLACIESGSDFLCRLESSINLVGSTEPCGAGTDDICDEGFVCVYGGLLPGCTEAACCAELCNLLGEGSECTTQTVCSPLDNATHPELGACYIPF